MPNFTDKQIDLLNSLGKYYPVFNQINQEGMFGNTLKNISDNVSPVVRKFLDINSPDTGLLLQTDSDNVSRLEVDVLDPFDDNNSEVIIYGDEVLMDSSLSDLSEKNKFISYLNKQINGIKIYYNIYKGNSTKGKLEISIFKG